jgi:hypothetical protein
MEITNVDLGAVFLEAGPAKDFPLTFSGAGTMKEGTILAYNTSTNKLVPFATSGANGIDNPRFVLSYDVTADGAGDELVRVPLSGVVAFERLIISADGDNSNLTQQHRNAMGVNGFQVVDVQQLARLDNQPAD